MCGQHRKMNEAHVPPRALGNHRHLWERALWVADETGRD